MFRSNIKKTAALCLVAVLSLCILYFKDSHAFFTKDNKVCAAPGKPWNPVFQDLKGINLYVKVLENKEVSANPVLWREAVLPLVINQITKNVLPFVDRDAECELPEIKLLNSSNVHQAVNEAGTLTYTIIISFFSTEKGAVAALTLHYFRPDLKVPDFGMQVEFTGVTVIPVEYNAFELKKRIQNFINNNMLIAVLYGERDYAIDKGNP